MTIADLAGFGSWRLTVLMTVDTVGGVWNYAERLCAALDEIRFVWAQMGPPVLAEHRARIARLTNVVLHESDYRLEWMADAAEDLSAGRRWLAELARREVVDLIHINGFAHASLGIEAPSVVVAHSDVLSWWHAVHGCAAPPQWHAYRRRVAAGLAAARRIVAPSAAVMNDLTTHYPVPIQRAAIIANGIDPSDYRAVPKSPKILAAGRIWDEAKNLQILDAVAPRLDWPIEIAGDVDHPEGGKARFDNVRLLGRLTAAQMAQQLASASIFVAPARYEPFGLAILEAAAAGCALVLSDIPSLRENWRGAATFVPPDDVAALSSALRHLIADTGECARLADAAHRRAQRFTIRRTAAAYHALYGELVDDAARLETA
ncbi:MAG: glycosyltransferase family 4 protein [Alphaproteobacteria bacterium]|nr:glycosyltransferase family 4 protein [Alphaproteobacteria bacterium]